jgi:hypothetical protein
MRLESAAEPDAEIPGDLGPVFGIARTRICLETRHLAFLDGLVTRVRIENRGRVSRAELIAILVRVLLSAELNPGKVRSESDLIVQLHESDSSVEAAADEGMR